MDLQQIKQKIDAELALAVKNRKSDFHVLNLADKQPSVRSLVLRGFEQNSIIWFHTHYSSTKVQFLSEHPEVCIHGYCRLNKVQLRIYGCAEILHSDQDSMIKWDNLPASARRCYLAETPGAVLESAGSGYAEEFDQNKLLKQPETEFARGNFSRIKVDIFRIDYLSLAASGHRRAIFDKTENGWDGAWAVP